MTTSILKKLRQGKTLESIPSDLAAVDILARTLVRALRDNELEVEETVEEEKVDVAAIESERDQAKAKYEATQALVEELRSSVQSLKDEIKIRDGKIETLNADFNKERQGFSDKVSLAKHDLGQERKKIQALEVELARVKGQLEQAKKPVIIKEKAKKSEPMPQFKFTPVRNHEGRTVSVTATPILPH